MNLSENIKDKIFSQIGLLADELGMECYLIGGYVRDLLLGRPSKDIDVVVVGSGISFAEALRKRLGQGAKLALFKTYGTAQVKTRELEIEIVGARRESYHHTSRNPIVEQGTLEDDQNRRDFTINALAICLNQARFGELIDPFGGAGASGTEDYKNAVRPEYDIFRRPSANDESHTFCHPTWL